MKYTAADNRNFLTKKAQSNILLIIIKSLSCTEPIFMHKALSFEFLNRLHLRGELSLSIAKM